MVFLWMGWSLSKLSKSWYGHCVLSLILVNVAKYANFCYLALTKEKSVFKCAVGEMLKYFGHKKNTKIYSVTQT